MIEREVIFEFEPDDEFPIPCIWIRDLNNKIICSISPLILIYLGIEMSDGERKKVKLVVEDA